jgi:tRNA G18 (ribose-2'-O)-methylase SpoU
MPKNTMVNYADIIADTTSKHYNVHDQYKHNTIEQNVEICKSDRLKFSVGCINITGELNIGMMIRSACLMGAENFYIFGRNKFDKRSTVGAEKYINIIQHTFTDPLHADQKICDVLMEPEQAQFDILLCETGERTIGKYSNVWNDVVNPLFLFGSESHGIPEIIRTEFSQISIPQRGVIRSFNVSAAMNIIVWDYIKEKQPW